MGELAMEKHIERTYYALVWSTSLKRNRRIRGKLIDGNVVLPKDNSILYGTSDNDIAKLRTVDYENKVYYNTKTGEQVVKFNKIEEEFILPRDVRIITWRGYDSVNPLKERYKVIGVDFFEEMVEIRRELEEKGFEYCPDVYHYNAEDVNLEYGFEFEVFSCVDFTRELEEKGLIRLHTRK